MIDVHTKGAPARSRDRSAAARFPGWLRGRVAKVLLLLAAVTGCAAPLIALNIHRNTQLSIFDEVSYLDYLYRVDHGQFIVGKGDQVSAYTMRVVACRSIQGGAAPNPAICSGKKPIGPRYMDSADIDPPTYYVVTAVGAKVIRSLGVTRDLLVSGRLMGVAWAAAGLTLLLLFCRRLGASWLAAALVTGFVLVMPLYLANWTYVTPHAAELVVTVSVLWVTVNWAQGGGRWWHLALIGLLPPAVKATDVLATALAVLLLLIAAFRTWRSRTQREDAAAATRRLLGGAALLCASTLLFSVVWLAIRSHYSIMAGNEFPMFNVHHFSLTFLTSTLALFLQPQALLADGQISVAVLLQLALFGAALVVLRSPVRSLTLWPLAGAVLVGGIFGPWLFVLFNYVVLGQFVTPLPIRYGLSVFSGAAAVLACGMRTRVPMVAVSVLGLLLLSIDLVPGHWP